MAHRERTRGWQPVSVDSAGAAAAAGRRVSGCRRAANICALAARNTQFREETNLMLAKTPCMGAI
eukprot:2710046-Prymnesium_polylepis.1